jgi:hypothetical protein
MTYTILKTLINNAYAEFCERYIVKETLGVDNEYSYTRLFFIKVIYKVLMNQEGDETKDLLTTEEIQNCIVLFDKYANSIIPIEYS